MSRGTYRAFGVAALLVFVLGCDATPKKVCRHLATLDAENAESCTADMKAMADTYPQYWGDIGVCFLSSKEKEELGTCYEVIDTVRLQDFCQGVLTRLPEAYRGSVSNCLREHRGLLRTDEQQWEARRDCVLQADSAEAVRDCRRSSAR